MAHGPLVFGIGLMKKEVQEMGPEKWDQKIPSNDNSKKSIIST